MAKSARGRKNVFCRTAAVFAFGGVALSAACATTEAPLAHSGAPNSAGAESVFAAGSAPDVNDSESGEASTGGQTTEVREHGRDDSESSGAGGEIFTDSSSMSGAGGKYDAGGEANVGGSSAGTTGGDGTAMIPCAVQAAYSVCRNCHGNPPLNGAPFPLVTLTDLQSYAAQEAEAVSTGVMPAAGTLSPGDKRSMLDWLRAGALGVATASCP